MNASAQGVFLSYASQDAEAAQRICHALRTAGLEVWFDRNELRGGDAWDASIRKKIKECALFVPIISANTESRSEGYFRLEWKLAVDRSHLMADDRTFLLPVVIDDTAETVARVPDRFRERQWTRLPGGATPAAFSERVHRLLSGGAAPPSPVAPPRVVGAAAPAMTLPANEPPSIAVLPFVNRSHAEEDEYFSDGLADELLNVLTKIRGLRVAARSSASTFKGKGATVAEVGRTLNVATVLEGSVRKAGNRMRISVQLVKVADGYQLWSDTYDRTLEDIFAVQDDIAQSVVKELRTTLLGEAVDAKTGKEVTAAVAAAAKGRATDPEAHRLYLQARHLIARGTREDVAKGIAYLKQALALEPAFALAWVALGGTYSREADHGWVPVAEGFGRAREAVGRALALEPDLAPGHALMGWIQMRHDWDWRGADASTARALELAPGSRVVLSQAGSLANTLGRLDEAIEFYRRAVEDDPLSAGAYNNLGFSLYQVARLAEAEAATRKALELSPGSAGTRAFLSQIVLAQGKGEEALAEALREPDESQRLWALAIIHYTAGRRAESDEALRELIAKYQANEAWRVATTYGARGEADLAFEWLEQAYAQRDPRLSEMRIHPLLRPVRADPRWDVFLRKMGLAD